MCCMEDSDVDGSAAELAQLLDNLKAAQRPNKGSRARDARACGRPVKKAESSRVLPPRGVEGKLYADACDMSNVLVWPGRPRTEFEVRRAKKSAGRGGLQRPALARARGSREGPAHSTRSMALCAKQKTRAACRCREQ